MELLEAKWMEAAMEQLRTTHAQNVGEGAIVLRWKASDEYSPTTPGKLVVAEQGPKIHASIADAVHEAERLAVKEGQTFFVYACVARVGPAKRPIETREVTIG